MRITLSTSILARNQIARTTQAIARSLERLSTGKRVSSPRDDPASYSMLTRLDSQLRGLSSAIRNVNDGAALIQTASGAISTQIDLLHRIRELALEASSSTLSSEERSDLNNEFQLLMEEFRRITDETEYNGKKLLDGSFGTQTLQVGANAGQEIDLEIGSLKASSVFEKTVGSGSFTSRVTQSMAGGNAYRLEVVDVNNDGYLDMLGTNTGGVNTLSVKLGTGNGNFIPATTYIVGANPYALTVGDFDGDGSLDAVVGSSSEISILIGNGDGTFQARRTLSANSANDLAAGDIDLDGDLDILATNEFGAPEIIQLLGDGQGNFTEGALVTASPSNQGIEMGDFNNDGILDYAVGSGSGGASSTFSIGIGRGDGTFSESTMTLGDTPWTSTIGDFNNDGNQDLAIVTIFSNEVSIRLGRGDGTFTTATTLSVTTPWWIANDDVNGDGIADLWVKSNLPTTSSLFLGNGDGTFTASTTFIATSNADVAIRDINQDGAPDLLTGGNWSNGVSIFYGVPKTISAGGSDLNLNSDEKAKALLDIVDQAIENLEKERGNLAALHSRLDVVASLNLLQSENLEETKSLIGDADYAMEVANLVYYQMLQDAQIAVMAQANIKLQTVLQLLQF